MSNTNIMPNVSQLQDHMQYFIAYLVVHHKPELLKIIRDNGIVMVNPNDSEIIRAVFVAISKSASFRKDLQMLMTNVAVSELNIQAPKLNFVASAPNVKTIDDFVKGGVKSKDGFSNLLGFDDDFLNGNTPHSWEDVEDPIINNNGAASGGHEGDTPAANQAKAATTKKAFADTAVGGFLSSLFTKSNIEKAASAGIDLLGQKLSANANSQEAKDMTQLQIAQTEKYKAQIEAEKARNKWLIPTLIISGLVVVAVVVIIVSKRKKTA